MSRPSKPARQFSFDRPSQNGPTLKGAAPQSGDPFPPRQTPRPSLPPPIDGGCYPELEVQNPRRASANGMPWKDLNFFVLAFLPSGFFPLNFLFLLFFWVLLFFIQPLPTAYSAEGPAGGIPVPPPINYPIKGHPPRKYGYCLFFGGPTWRLGCGGAPVQSIATWVGPNAFGHGFGVSRRKSTAVVHRRWARGRLPVRGRVQNTPFHRKAVATTDKSRQHGLTLNSS